MILRFPSINYALYPAISESSHLTADHSSNTYRLLHNASEGQLGEVLSLHSLRFPPPCFSYTKINVWSLATEHV